MSPARAPLLVVASLLLFVPALGAEEPKLPRKPNDKVIEAWKKAGFEFGWLGKYQPFENSATDWGDQFRPADCARWDRRGRIQPKLPAFRLRGNLPKPEELCRLPGPDMEFALCFFDAQSARELLAPWLEGLGELKGMGKLGHLAGLDLREVKGSVVDDRVLKALAPLNLTWLDLGDAKLTPAGWKLLGGMKTLKWLSHRTTEVTEEGLKELANLHRLESLELGAVGRAGMKVIGKLKNLTELSLAVDDETRKGLEELAGLQNLRALRLWADNEDLGALPNLNNLTSLDLSGCRPEGEYRGVTDKGVEALARFERLSVLNLGSTGVTGEGLEKLTNLEELNLSLAPVTDKGLKDVGRLRKLTKLNLKLDFRVKGTKVTAKGLEPLAGLENLIDLRLRGVPITGAGLRKLEGLKKLQRVEFDLDRKDVTDDVLGALRESRLLHVCSLVQGYLPDVPPKGIQEVKKLSLADTQVTDEGLKKIRDLSGLTSLDLANTQVTDEGLKELEGLKNLEKLDLTNTQVTDEGVNDLQEALPDCKIETGKPRKPRPPRPWPALVAMRRWSLTVGVIALVATLALAALREILDRVEVARTPDAPQAPTSRPRWVLVWIRHVVSATCLLCGLAVVACCVLFLIAQVLVELSSSGHWLMQAVMLVAVFVVFVVASVIKTQWDRFQQEQR